MSKDGQLSAMDSGSTESANRLDPGIRTEREIWIHEFRNALGNIVIAASAAKSEQAKNQQSSILICHIEDGCKRCLRLLDTMPD